MKKSFFLGTLLSISLLLFNSCSKKDTPGIKTIKSAKFTVTVTGINSEDLLTVVFSSGTLPGVTGPVWKVDGTARPNEDVISFGDADFPGASKTYVVELAQEVPAIAAGVQTMNFGAPFTISYKAEINGKVTQEYTKVIQEGQPFNVDYSFP